ncbi:MAG TPA: hypothetical protein VJV22_13680 [Acidobacteriaceae bacterium]|nr:hypothetical protein [Acidobacteriaceae bacterium]
MKHYRSSLPKNARERVVATHIAGPQKYKAEYWMNRKLVGIRYFSPNGELQSECPLKDGRRHGILYFFEDDPARVRSSEPWRNGLPHGVARQYGGDGKLLGTYTMKHGTGLDLWWQDFPGGQAYLSEARYYCAGKLHGFEWWLEADQRHVWQERHFAENLLHGIERDWNSRGRVNRGYRRYWIRGRRVTKRQYLSACRKDPSLPRYRESDNKPFRNFPPEVAANLRPVTK